MDDLFPNLFRTLANYMAGYGVVVLVPLAALAIWLLVPKGAIRILGAVLVIGVVVFYWFGDHPAIAPIISAMGNAAYHFRSLF